MAIVLFVGSMSMQSCTSMEEKKKVVAVENVIPSEKPIADANIIEEDNLDDPESPKGTFNDFYGVYEFEEGVYGITFYRIGQRKGLDIYPYFSMSPTKLEKKVRYPNTILPLYEDVELTAEYNAFIQDTFYVYSKTGVSTAIVKKVLFPIDECRGGFGVLELETTTKEDQLLFASKKKLDLDYGTYPTIEQRYNNHQDSIQECEFEEDTKHIKVFAKYDGYYLGYRNEDNFRDATRIIPYRHIFNFEEYKNTLQFCKTAKFSLIDMYGCSCD